MSNNPPAQSLRQKTMLSLGSFFSSGQNATNNNVVESQKTIDLIQDGTMILSQTANKKYPPVQQQIISSPMIGTKNHLRVKH